MAQQSELTVRMIKADVGMKYTTLPLIMSRLRDRLTSVE